MLQCPKQVLHHDIKPANLIPLLPLKISLFTVPIDFGAKKHQVTSTTTSLINKHSLTAAVGTPGFAPLQNSSKGSPSL